MSIGHPTTRRRPRGPELRRGFERPVDPRITRPPTGRRDWRAEATGWSALNVIAGVWLIIAPWVLGYSGADPKWNDVVFGAIVGVFALIRAAGAYREEWLSWLNAAIGGWLFIAAFTIDHTATAGWNDVILGIIVFVLAVASADASSMLRRRGRRVVPPPRV